MSKTILFNGKKEDFIQFFSVLPKQRFTVGKTQVPTLLSTILSIVLELDKLRTEFYNTRESR